MEKIIGLDVGSKTIGISTTQGIIAQPGPTLKFEEFNFDEAFSLISDYIKNNSITKIIVGYPLNMNGTKSNTTEMVDYFIEGLIYYNPNLKEENIIKVDERKTTVMARNILQESGIKFKDQKKFKDSLAAQLILETYLNKTK